MITPCGFDRVYPEMLGHGRVQWTLEETGLPCRFHALDFTAGELESVADILLATVLRQVGHTRSLDPYPRPCA